MNNFKSLAVAAAALFAWSSAGAQNTILGFSLDTPTYKIKLEQQALANVGDEARLTIEKEANSLNCGVEVDWGDGDKQKVRLDAGQTINLTHAYKAAGNFNVTVDGKLVARGLFSAIPCVGNAQVAAVQVAAGAAVAIAPASAPAPASLPVDAPPQAQEAVPVSTVAIASAPTTVASLDTALLGDEAGGKRVALLIGNTSYQGSMTRLLNPGKDVAMMDSALKKLGFEVHKALDTNKRNLMTSVRQFARSAESASVALLYYSGHGIQSQGENYLVPVDANIDKEADLDVEAVRLDNLMRMIEESKPRYTVVALDACRDNPIAKRTKSGLQGLARVTQQPTSSFVAYATQAGTTAQDDGVFARSMAQRIQQQGVGLRTVFDLVARDVEAASGGKQQPLRLDGLRNDVFLNGRAALAAVPAPAAPELPPLCRDQAGDALKACMRWQCQTDSGKTFQAACKVHM
jgi:hypothetical protein